MRKLILAIILVSTVLLLSTCAKRKEGYCRLRSQQVDITKPSIYFTCQFQSKLSEKPNQLRDMPEKISNRVNYFLAKIADREIPLIIDRGDKSKLYLDTDGDSSLSDEKGFAYKAIKERFFGPVDYYRFGPISLKFEQAAGKFTQQIFVFTRDSYFRRLIFSPANCCKGSILLDGNIYEVRVLDGNFDEKYDKVFSPPFEQIWKLGCDSFAIDLNRNGKLDYHYYQQSELMPLGKMVKVGDSYYSIKVNESGESLELNKAQPDFGTLALGNEKIKLKLWSDATQQYITNFEKNIQVPAGRYQALFLELSRRDSKNNTWDFTCYRDTGSLKNFEINKNQTTSFKIGPPFKIETITRPVRDKVNIDFKLIGQASEQYRPDVKRNGRRVSPPIIRIIDEQESEIESAQLQYG